MKTFYTTLLALILSGGLLACLTLALLYQATGEDQVSGASSMEKKRQAENPVEVGDVAWGRDLERALASAKKSGKPVFALFQEVPG
ncbi:MAG: hypothetical protein KDN22_22650 [Verrucomicrobiae bacterium]|nr:hypothetical protein [Verrucomicrobiae bacterium]